MISLLIPTRGRYQNIKTLLSNIVQMSYNMQEVEILIAFDRDDKATHEELQNIRSNKYSVYCVAREKSSFLNRDYYNFLAEKTYNGVLWAFADDIRILTKNWDKILEDKIKDYTKNKPDGIAYISVNEKDSKAKHPCFPLITREAFQVLNMYFHPQLKSWGADRCLWELYNGVNRILHVPEVTIEHLSYHDGKGEFDETAKSMRERFFEDPDCHNKVCANIIPNQIKKLKEFIGKKYD